jgi:hypothetical protein
MYVRDICWLTSVDQVIDSVHVCSEPYVPDKTSSVNSLSATVMGKPLISRLRGRHEAKLSLPGNVAAIILRPVHG